jgi:hypothetical protein
MNRIRIFDAETGIKIFDCLAESEDVKSFKPPDDPRLMFLADTFDAIRNEFPGRERGFLTVLRNGKSQEIWWEIEPIAGMKTPQGSLESVARSFL